MSNFDYDSDCTRDCPSIAEGMTEEEAMQIWLRRDAETEEQLQHERQLRREQQPPNELQCDLHGAEPVQQQQQQQQQGSSSNHDVHMAYQRFMSLNRPGLAEAYVPSTPGLAMLLEQARQEDAMAAAAERRRQEDQQRQEELEARQQRLSAAQGQGYESSSNYATGGAPPQASAFSASHAQFPLDAQVREYERLSQAHRHQQNYHTSHNNSRPPNGVTMTSTSSTRDDSSSKDKKNDGKDGKDGKDNDNTIPSFYIALPHRTEYSTKPVICAYCRVTLYTHPLAQSFFCQTCGQITALQATTALDREDEDPGTGWEEKMADWEDDDIQMGLGY